MWNNPTTRLAKCLDFFDEEMRNYDQDWSVITTGHSLGGALAEHLSVKRERVNHCESFNPGTSYLGSWTAPIHWMKSFVNSFRNDYKNIKEE